MKYLPAGSLGASPLDDSSGPRIRRNRPRGAAAPDPILGFLSSNVLQADGAEEHALERDWPPPLLVDGRVPEGGMATRRRPELQEENGYPHMPEGINVEEAKYALFTSCMRSDHIWQDLACLKEHARP